MESSLVDFSQPLGVLRKRARDGVEAAVVLVRQYFLAEETVDGSVFAALLRPESVSGDGDVWAAAVRAPKETAEQIRRTFCAKDRRFVATNQKNLARFAHFFREQCVSAAMSFAALHKMCISLILEQEQNENVTAILRAARKVTMWVLANLNSYFDSALFARVSYDSHPKFDNLLRVKIMRYLMEGLMIAFLYIDLPDNKDLVRLFENFTAFSAESIPDNSDDSEMFLANSVIAFLCATMRPAKRLLELQDIRPALDRIRNKSFEQHNAPLFLIQALLFNEAQRDVLGFDDSFGGIVDLVRTNSPHTYLLRCMKLLFEYEEETESDPLKKTVRELVQNEIGFIPLRNYTDFQDLVELYSLCFRGDADACEEFWDDSNKYYREKFLECVCERFPLDYDGIRFLSSVSSGEAASEKAVIFLFEFSNATIRLHPDDFDKLEKEAVGPNAVTLKKGAMLCGDMFLATPKRREEHKCLRIPRESKGRILSSEWPSDDKYIQWTMRESYTVSLMFGEVQTFLVNRGMTAEKKKNVAAVFSFFAEILSNIKLEHILGVFRVMSNMLPSGYSPIDDMYDCAAEAARIVLLATNPDRRLLSLGTAALRLMISMCRINPEKVCCALGELPVDEGIDYRRTGIERFLLGDPKTLDDRIDFICAYIDVCRTICEYTMSTNEDDICFRTMVAICHRMLNQVCLNIFISVGSILDYGSYHQVRVYEKVFDMLIAIFWDALHKGNKYIAAYALNIVHNDERFAAGLTGSSLFNLSVLRTPDPAYFDCLAKGLKLIRYAFVLQRYENVDKTLLSDALLSPNRISGTQDFTTMCCLLLSGNFSDPVVNQTLRLLTACCATSGMMNQALRFSSEELPIGSEFDAPTKERFADAIEDVLCSDSYFMDTRRVAVRFMNVALNHSGSLARVFFSDARMGITKVLFFWLSKHKDLMKSFPALLEEVLALIFTMRSHGDLVFFCGKQFSLSKEFWEHITDVVKMEPTGKFSRCVCQARAFDIISQEFVFSPTELPPECKEIVMENIGGSNFHKWYAYLKKMLDYKTEALDRMIETSQLIDTDPNKFVRIDHIEPSMVRKYSTSNFLYDTKYMKVRQSYSRCCYAGGNAIRSSDITIMKAADCALETEALCVNNEVLVLYSRVQIARAWGTLFSAAFGKLMKELFPDQSYGRAFVEICDLIQECPENVLGDVMFNVFARTLNEFCHPDAGMKFTDDISEDILEVLINRLVRGFKAGHLTTKAPNFYETVLSISPQESCIQNTYSILNVLLPYFIEHKSSFPEVVTVDMFHSLVEVFSNPDVWVALEGNNLFFSSLCYALSVVVPHVKDTDENMEKLAMVMTDASGRLRTALNSKTSAKMAQSLLVLMNAIARRKKAVASLHDSVPVLWNSNNAFFNEEWYATWYVKARPNEWNIVWMQMMDLICSLLSTLPTSIEKQRNIVNAIVSQQQFMLKVVNFVDIILSRTTASVMQLKNAQRVMICALCISKTCSQNAAFSNVLEDFARYVAANFLRSYYFFIQNPDKISTGFTPMCAEERARLGKPTDKVPIVASAFYNPDTGNSGPQKCDEYALLIDSMLYSLAEVASTTCLNLIPDMDRMNSHEAIDELHSKFVPIFRQFAEYACTTPSVSHIYGILHYMSGACTSNSSEEVQVKCARLVEKLSLVLVVHMVMFCRDIGPTETDKRFKHSELARDFDTLLHKIRGRPEVLAGMTHMIGAIAETLHGGFK